MTPVEDRTFQNETVVFDGKYFHRCSFSNCTLLFMGGDYAWSECKFFVNVWTFRGAAWRTIQLLKEQGMKLSDFKSDVPNLPNPSNTPS